MTKAETTCARSVKDSVKVGEMQNDTIRLQEQDEEEKGPRPRNSSDN